VARRDTLTKEVKSKDGIHILKVFRKIQLDLFTKALDYRNTHITEVNDFEEFKQVLEDKGGFVSAHWDGSAEKTEEKKIVVTFWHEGGNLRVYWESFIESAF
jgi:prolyl-tRNA synthetase